MATTIKLYYNHCGAIADAMVPRARTIVEKTANDAKGHSQKSMEGPKSGRWYLSSKTGKMHQASAPGEPPAIDTTHLQTSHEVEMDGSKPQATINVFAEYAETLEFGGANVAARPYLRPALLKVQPSFEAAMSSLFALPGSSDIVVTRTPVLSEGGK
jgi:hypothetical protein